jgi:hypothetical protein
MRAARLLAVALGTGVLAAPGACAESQAPAGHGDNVILDVDASGSQGDNGGGDDAALPDDSPFTPVDSGYGAVPDGYAPFEWCSQCSCPSGTFCFGGGSGYTNFTGDCHADAGALGSAPLAVGCYPLPPACANEPSCECLILAISQDMPCYPVCSVTSDIVYCPHP